MKRIYTSLLTFAVLALFILSCSKDDAVPSPTADFSFTVSNLAVTFTNAATNSRYFTWDFGDGTTSNQMSPGHSYEEGGTYNVKLTVTGRDGSTQEVTRQVTAVEAPNLVVGGKFNAGDESNWTVMNLSPGVTVTFANGKATWAGGNWGHAGIYQAVQVEAGKKYGVNMQVAGKGATDTWFEVYVGMATPVQGQDYSDGGKRLAINTWAGCGKTEFSGPLTAVSCDGKDGGEVTFPTSGKAYLVIRSGGANLGDGGIVVDNVELRPKQ